MRLLGLLVEDYDRRHGMPDEEDTPAEKLQFLMEHSGKTPADLFPIFGQRSSVSEVLSGKRKISADEARALGKLFRMKAGLFLYGARDWPLGSSGPASFLAGIARGPLRRLSRSIHRKRHCSPLVV